jgi:hypothetical protein
VLQVERLDLRHHLGVLEVRLARLQRGLIRLVHREQLEPQRGIDERGGALRDPLLRRGDERGPPRVRVQRVEIGVGLEVRDLALDHLRRRRHELREREIDLAVERVAARGTVQRVAPRAADRGLRHRHERLRTPGPVLRVVGGHRLGLVGGSRRDRNRRGGSRGGSRARLRGSPAAGNQQERAQSLRGHTYLHPVMCRSRSLP